MNTPSFIRTLTIISFTLIGGVVIFSAVAIMNSDTLFFSLTETDDYNFLIAGVFTILSSAMGRRIYQSRITGIESQLLEDKKATYQTAIIIRLALLEAAALFSAAMLLLSGNMAFIVFIVMLLIMMLAAFPSTRHFISVGQLTKDEISQL